MQIITLTTDFGLVDSYVGAMKGVILSIAPDVRLVDLCHEVPPQDVRAGSFVLYQATSYFPNNTIHVAVVDPGVGSARSALAVSTDQGIFVAPDNGLLSLVLSSAKMFQAVSLTNQDYHLASPSATFHGRDVFAPAAAHLAAGVPLSKLGSPVTNLVRLERPHSETAASNHLVAHVLHVDRFGNLILDVTGDNITPKMMFELPGYSPVPLRSTFADVASGFPVVYIGSTRNHVEIAIRNGNAARTLGLSVDDNILIRKGTE